MKKVLSFICHPVVISLIGLIAISLLIWFVGPQIKWGEDNTAPFASTTVRMVLIMIALVIWGLNNLWIQLRNKKTNDNLVSGLAESKNDAASISSEQSSEELHQIGERFSQAMDTLKRFKFKGANGSKALYELPWYIIVGPPGSGKTTALVNSGLDFPLADHFGKASLQGVGGTRNCDWWFTNEAVLIDTAGRYTTQDSHKVIDSNAWEGFLALLKKNRRRRPINGAIVAISLQDLLMQTEDERRLHAKTIRARLDELMEKLQIRFPVYLMFTKADLISGFTEFFDDYSKDDREQVWGVSLPDAPSANDTPDFDFLKKELMRLTRRLYDRVLARIHQERDPARRAAIQGFPQQFENLNAIAESFVAQTFIPNRFKFQPYLRGVYFSSGTQDGTPIDRLMASVAANFGFTRDVAQSAHHQGKSYFLNRLFREIIFPESELVGSNVAYERTMRWVARGSYAAMLIVLVVLGMTWFGGVMQHKSYMGDVAAKIQDYQSSLKNVSAWSSDVRQVLPPLQSLVEASLVYDRQEHPWLSTLGMYDGRVDAGAEDAYQQQLRTLFLPKAISALEATLKQGYKASDLYNTFRIYMMFKKTEYMDTDRVQEWFVDHWEQTLPGEGTTRKELEFHLKQLLALELQPMSLNSALISDVRATLLREPVAQRVYSRLRTNPLFSRRVDLLSQYGDAVRTAFDLNEGLQRALQIPYLFSKEAYDNIDLSADSPLVTDIVNERWVLTDDAGSKVDFIEDDLGEVSDQVKSLYLSEYIEVWSKVYSALEVTDFRNIRHAEEVLAAMTDPVYSPLLRILQVGRLNTQLAPPKEGLEDAAAKNPKKSRALSFATSLALSQYEGTKVDKHFRELNILVSESARGPSPVSGIMDKVRDLHGFMADVSLAPDPSKAAFDVAKARFKSGSPNAITGLLAYSQSLPEPVKTWLEKLCDQSWKVLVAQGRGHMDNEWRALVYRPYNEQLKNRYPLNRGANDEVPMYEFTEYFKPGGTLDKFYAEYMQPFVTTRNGWRNRAVDRYSMGISASVLRTMENAHAIKQIFYRENPSAVSVTMELRPKSMEENDARFILDVGDDRITYNHGPKFWKRINWTANQDNMRVRLVFESLNGSQIDRDYHGPWAWFKLLDASYVQKTAQATTYLVTFSAGDDRGTNQDAHKIVYEVKTKSTDNPFRREVLSAFNCPESI